MAEERWKQSFKNQRYRLRKNAGLPRLLSEGDSWFAYPIYRNLIDYIDDTERYAIRRTEQSGDRLDEIMDPTGAPLLGLRGPEVTQASPPPRTALSSCGSSAGRPNTPRRSPGPATDRRRRRRS